MCATIKCENMIILCANKLRETNVSDSHQILESNLLHVDWVRDLLFKSIQQL